MNFENHCHRKYFQTSKFLQNWLIGESPTYSNGMNYTDQSDKLWGIEVTDKTFYKDKKNITLVFLSSI